MKALIQRVSQARVEVGGKTVANIDQGILAFIGIEKSDTEAQADQLLAKILNYRIFADAEARMNLSLLDAGAELLLVSQFTLAADTHRGLRPSFSAAAPPELAEPLYDYLVAQAKGGQEGVQSGIFAADMQVQLINDGPVTFLLEA